MRYPALAIALALALSPRSILAAACCLGGGPKSFISLQRLQKYELGLSSGLRDVYGRYNVYGELEPAESLVTASLSLGAGVRLTESLQAFAVAPIISAWGYGSRQGIGDVLVGAEYLLVESLYRDDWYPTVALSAGLKAPSGSIDTLRSGRRLPGTGNGQWEPFVGVAVSKAFGLPLVTLKAGYTARLSGAAQADGDLVELSETVALPFTQRFNLAIGSTQSWNLGRRAVADSAGRVITAFVSPTYYLTRFWSVAASAEASLPLDGWGVNQPATRVATLTVKYGFY